MSKTSIFAKMRRDGSLLRTNPDGSEEVVPVEPLAPMRATDSAADIEAAAVRDPDAQPLTEADMARLRQVPRVKTLRRALGLTQEEFAACYRIPVGTLRDWEQGRTEPDQPARAYLTVIARDPEGVRRALQDAPVPAAREG
jgi:putative transcriptional regulator